MLEEGQKQGTCVASTHPDGTDTCLEDHRQTPTTAKMQKFEQCIERWRCDARDPPHPSKFSKDVISRSEHLTYVEKGWPETAGVQLPGSHTLPVTTRPRTCPHYTICYLLCRVKGVTNLLLGTSDVKGPWLMGKACSGEKGDIATH